MEISLSLLLLLPFLFPFSSLLCRQVSSQIADDDDREETILLKLKNNWNNPTLNSKWSSMLDSLGTGGPHCNWRGITCINGFVTEIALSEINITEKIPNFICDLKKLARIDLSYNYIPGEFPTCLYNCSKLQKLDLSQNYFVGQIPSDIDRISTLRILNLAANSFSGHIPTAVGRLPVLQNLLLDNNLFNGTFPPEIGNLSNLQELELAHNQFIPSRIPSEFGRLKKLRTLWMTNSNLIGVIPESIGNLTNLRYLNLSTNRLIGEIPESIGNLPNLRYLSLSTNRLNETIPSNLFLSKNLTILSLRDNRLSGEIPRKIETLNLITIDLSINMLTGTIPEDFGKLQYLRNFYMYANRLHGEIPASIGRIPTLVSTRLFRNNLTGVLPPDFGLYSKLEEIQVSENQLTGNLPENLCAGRVFSKLGAFSNNLNGTLPKSLLNCSSLYYVAVHHNQFSGEIPAKFWLLGNLSTVILGDNSFSGEFPDEMGSNFERIGISNNRFFGKLPSQIAGSTDLIVFQASNNLLSGEIPYGFTSLSRLETLSLDGNRLSGQIPSKFIPWSPLVTLNLSGNQLSGELPSEIVLLRYLTVLDLSENQISGEIPSGFMFPKLTFFNLSSNRFSGRIPVEFENQAYSRSFLNNPGLCTGSLNLNPEACLFESRDSHKLSSGLLTMILIISGAILLVVISFILFMKRHTRRKKHKKDLPATWKLTLFQILDFTESDILSSLTEDNVIGSGGSGKVYRVQTNHTGNNYVAVKKIWSQGKLDQQLEKQFQSEVHILGTIRHSSIVKLLCCISSDNSKLLVYEYMENGSLHQWLHGRKQRSLDSINRNVLDWPRRLGIAIEAAQGLCYIHHNCSPPIIHRDVKSCNILLDSEFKARIADFGLAKMVVNHGEAKTASVIAGSFGYIAPEYARTTKITEKIDVYSFGVVLLELATGRKANHGHEHTCLAEWAWRQHQEGNNVDDALDEDVKKPCYLDEMRMVFKLGLICTGPLPSHRPSMKQTLQILQRHDPIIGASRVEEEVEELASPSDVTRDDIEIDLAPLNNV